MTELVLQLPEKDSNTGVSLETLSMYCQHRGVDLNAFINQTLAWHMGFRVPATDYDEWETPLRRMGVEPIDPESLRGSMDKFLAQMELLKKDE
ncbi:hypothetical protein [Leeia oryzae]|uniref:hypothetical protein n=1 Tax=Leeia oryzae TaxID=356662 RepID=UPI0003819DE3|nr:hypothetical protein [Leeia oryzae]